MGDGVSELRKQNPAYEDRNVEYALSGYENTKPGGTAGRISYLSQRKDAGTGFYFVPKLLSHNKEAKT